MASLAALETDGPICPFGATSKRQRGTMGGLSMHPIEHVIYFSSVLIHLVLASHSLEAATSHAGFECLRPIPNLSPQIAEGTCAPKVLKWL